MVDAHFAEPRLAALYDVLEAPRDDLGPYVALADELGARSVLDVGCGTGTLACLLARRGMAVVGVDPAAASLDVARRKPHADAVRWVLGDATTLPPLQVDLATMTGNVAQVFLTDEDWAATLAGVFAALRPGGRLVFESRRPERAAWREWDRERTRSRVGGVESWVEVTAVRGPLVSFRTTFVLADDAAVLTSDSTLRFRTLDELRGSLAAAGFTVDGVREAPDRPGREFVLVARRPATTGQAPPAAASPAAAGAAPGSAGQAAGTAHQVVPSAPTVSPVQSATSDSAKPVQTSRAWNSS